MQKRLSYETREILLKAGQEEFVTLLENDQDGSLLNQAELVDWSFLRSLHKEKAVNGAISPIWVLSKEEHISKEETFSDTGIRAIQDGKLAVVILAGGQGSRLGFNGPKGEYNLGETHDVFIFELLIKELLRVKERTDSFIHTYIMTSRQNNEETISFFVKHRYFGYDEHYIHFYIQSELPALDREMNIVVDDGNLLLLPDGNGGWYNSLLRSNLHEEFEALAFDWINVVAVDNVLQKIADPCFLGATIEGSYDCAAKVIKKTDVNEKVGVICKKGNHPYILEYTELADEMKELYDDRNELVYCYGVTLNYLFSKKKLDEMRSMNLPLHRADKVTRQMYNGVKSERKVIKLEYLILDMIEHMDSCLPYEVVRELEFAPVKNLHGVDSVETAKQLLKKNGYEL